jgi:hypothetical protein
MATKAWRRASLRWPPTPEQWQALQQDLDYVYHWLRDLQANGGGGSTDVDLTHLDADNLTEGTVPAERMPALTGDVTTSVGTVATTLAASGVTADTYGDSTHYPQITVDAKGRITSATELALSGQDPICASVYRATAQTLTHNTAAAISFSNEHYDDGGLADLGTNATRLTATVDGVYTAKGQVAVGAGFQGTMLLQIAKNGTVVASQTSVGADLASGTEYHAFSADVDMVVDDYVEFKVTPTLAAGSGTVDTVGGTAATLFQLALVSPMTAPSGTFVKADGTVPLTADWAVGSHKLTGVTDPTDDQDAATKKYVDDHVATVNLSGANVSTREAQSSGVGYGDLATTGPAVTITTTGTTAIVWISAVADNSGSGNTAFISVDVSGASTVAASDNNAAAGSEGIGTGSVSLARVLTLTGLTPGSNVFTVKYKNDGGGWSFGRRSIAVYAP